MRNKTCSSFYLVSSYLTPIPNQKSPLSQDEPSLYFHREEVILLQRFCQIVLSEDLNLSEDDEEEMSGHLTRELQPKPLIMQDDDQLVPPPVDGRWKRLSL